MKKTESNKLCRLLGHTWLYKDYSNCMKANGDKYDFTASRVCTLCRKHGYFYDEWQSEKKTKLDFQSDSQSAKQPPHLQVQ
ncbi:MAG: hypothetical protein ACHQNT_06595 [Bacteroidia bacterium]